jgi:hypothetical protein
MVLIRLLSVKRKTVLEREYAGIIQQTPGVRYIAPLVKKMLVFYLPVLATLGGLRVLWLAHAFPRSNHALTRDTGPLKFLAVIAVPTAPVFSAMWWPRMSP